MMSTLNYTLRAAGNPEALKAYPSVTLRRAAPQLMAKEDVGQLRALYVADALDMLGAGAAVWRLIGNRQVTGGPPPPSIDETE